MAVWEGIETQGMAGTGFDIRTWRNAARALEVITPVPQEKTNTVNMAAIPVVGGQRELKAMLFGDVRGFSKLIELKIPAFVKHILDALGKVLARYGNRVLYRNTWGDGFFVVLSDAPVAAQYALQLQAAMAKLDLEAFGLPETLAPRLGGHFGPVFETTDPVLHLTNYFGAHVSRTARIEPVTPPGEVYVSEQFAARLALEPNAYACDYVGQIPAAKKLRHHAEVSSACTTHILITPEAMPLTTISTVRAFAGTTPYMVSLTDDLDNEWLSDEPLEFGGGNVGPSPERLLLSSLGACTAITLQMYAARKQWPLQSIEVELQFNPAGRPTSGNDITRKIVLKGDLDAEQRERLLQVANACPIHKVLSSEVRIDTSIVG